MNRLGVLFFIFSLACGFAQVNGGISGTVTDGTGAAVPNAQVEVSIAGGSAALFTAQTNNSGLFSFSAVRPEFYDVSISAPGFAKSITRRVKVDGIGIANLRVVLEVAKSEQVVEVSGEAPTVQLTSSELVTTISRKQLEQLPTANRQISGLFSCRLASLTVEGRR